MPTVHEQVPSRYHHERAVAVYCEENEVDDEDAEADGDSAGLKAGGDIGVAGAAGCGCGRWPVLMTLEPATIGARRGVPGATAGDPTLEDIAERVDDEPA